MQSRQPTSRSPGLPPPSSSQAEPQQQHPRASNASLGLDGLSLLERARALCTVADDVQRATIEASHRIAAIHGSPDRPKKKKTAAQTSVKKPPDICARSPSDVPPPRGEGWRRLGAVSVVRGSNRISAPAQTRRVLTRDVEVCVDGGRYAVIPADIEPGGGFCVSLDRDFVGETNMASMLYVRKKGGLVGSVDVGKEDPVGTAGEEVTEEESVVLPSKGESRPVPSLAPPPAAPAPFGSVGETTASRVDSPSPFSAGMERELDMFVMSRPQDRDEGGNTAAVRDAQRRARLRALSQRKLDTAAVDQRLNASEATKKAPTATEIQHFKASRRAARARVASQKQKELARKKQAECSAEEQRRQKEAEVAARADELRSVAMARAGNVAAQKRHRDREAEMSRRAEVRAKRERVAAVLAYDETKADEHEKRMRKETAGRIHREKRRRQLALQRQEDERMERMRLYEGGRRYDVVPVAGPAAVQTDRSFFSVSGSARSVSETASGNNCPYTAASPPGAPSRRRQSWRVPEYDDDEEDERAGKPGGRGGGGGGGGGHFAREEGSHGVGWRDQQAAGQVKKTQHRPRAAAEVAQRKALARHILSQTSQTRRGFEPAAQDSGGASINSTLGGNRNNGVTRVGAAAATAASGKCLAPAHLSPTLTSPSVGAGSASASGTSVGSGGTYPTGKKRRERIAATPVWKRPVVPLSKPYVPVPRRDSGRLAAP